MQHKHWERGKLPFPPCSLPTDRVSAKPDSEPSGWRQALSVMITSGCHKQWNSLSSFPLMFLLRFGPSKDEGLEEEQSAEGITGARWGQEVELGQWVQWDLLLAPSCERLPSVFNPVIALLSSPQPCSACTEDLLQEWVGRVKKCRKTKENLLL